GGDGHQVALGLVTKDGERLFARVEHPVMGDAGAVEHAQLVNQVAPPVRRQDLAHPVRPEPDGPPRRSLRHAFAAPADEVMAVELVRSVLDLDLGADPPSAGPAPARLADEVAPGEAAQ